MEALDTVRFVRYMQLRTVELRIDVCDDRAMSSASSFLITTRVSLLFLTKSETTAREATFDSFVHVIRLFPLW